MENKKIDITVDKDVKTVTILEGKTLELKAPMIIDLSGDINAPAVFIEKRTGDHPANTVHVIFNKDKREINLVCDEMNFYRKKITGTLLVNTQLASLQVNEEKEYNRAELYAKLKFFKRHFKTEAEYEKLVGKLKDFEVKVDQEFKQADDFKGKSSISKLTNIKSNIDLEFTLHIEIFKGFDKETFKVEINVALEHGDVVFWLESVELDEAMETATDKIFADMKAKFSDYVIINK